MDKTTDKTTDKTSDNTSDNTRDELSAPDESKENAEIPAASKETSESKDQNSDHGSEVSEPKEAAVENTDAKTEQISMSRHLVHVLTAPVEDTVSDDVATPGNASETVEEEEKNGSDPQNNTKKGH